jgi:hypothetical protein
MGFEHRSFNSELFRPRPEVSFHQSPQLLIVATPWGSRPGAAKVVEIMTDYCLATRDDSELTSPFERLSCLSRTANNLRIAALLANDWLYREENKSEYVSGVEVFAAAIFDQELVWLQVGAPQVFLRRKERALAPIGSALDLTFDLSAHSELMAPLPNQLLGLDNSVNMTLGSIRPQAEDQVILVSRSSLPSSFFVNGAEPQQLETLVKLLARDDAQLPFWVGLWSL